MSAPPFAARPPGSSPGAEGARIAAAAGAFGLAALPFGLLFGTPLEAVVAAALTGGTMWAALRPHRHGSRWRARAAGVLVGTLGHVPYWMLVGMTHPETTTSQWSVAHALAFASGMSLASLLFVGWATALVGTLLATLLADQLAL